MIPSSFPPIKPGTVDILKTDRPNFLFRMTARMPSVTAKSAGTPKKTSIKGSMESPEMPSRENAPE